MYVHTLIPVLRLQILQRSLHIQYSTYSSASHPDPCASSAAKLAAAAAAAAVAITAAAAAADPRQKTGKMSEPTGYLQQFLYCESNFTIYSGRGFSFWYNMLSATA